MSTIELTQENFEETIRNNEMVLVDFWAPWCGPCRTFGPVYEAVAEKHPQIVFAKVNTQDEQELAGSFQVRSIPTLMVFRDEVLLFAQAGALPGNVLEDLIDKVKELDMEEVRREIEEKEKN